MKKFKKIVYYIILIIFAGISISSFTSLSQPGMSFYSISLNILSGVIRIIAFCILVVWGYPKLHNKYIKKSKIVNVYSISLLCFIIFISSNSLSSYSDVYQAKNLGFNSKDELYDASKVNIYNKNDYDNYLEKKRVEQEKLEQAKLAKEKLEKEKLAQEQLNQERWNSFEQKLNDDMSKFKNDTGAMIFYCFQYDSNPKYRDALGYMYNEAEEANLVSSESTVFAQEIYGILHTNVNSAPDIIQKEMADQNLFIAIACTKLGDKGMQKLYN